MKTPTSGTGTLPGNASAAEGVKKSINGELWQACAGPLVNLPAAGTHVVYFPQGHSEQADLETDEVYAQMTLQPVPSDFTMQPPAQELVARDLHDNVWTFRHIYRGQPKRHLLTTGWSLFVSGKRLVAGDSVLFIRDEKQQLLLGIRRANRQPPNLSSSVLSSDSMHIGILAAAAHAAANNSPFTVFYNPRYMGTITGISDLDPVRWKNSQWRNLQVGWDESTAGERRNRVSIWEIEPVTAPFFICPTPPFFRSKRSRQPGMPDDDSSDLDSLFRRTMPWLGDEFGLRDPQALPGLSLVQWMNMQQNSSLSNSMQPNYVNPLPSSLLQNAAGTDISRQLGLPGTQISQHNNLQFNAQRPNQPVQQLDQLQKLPSSTLSPLSSITQPQQQLTDVAQPPRQSLVGQNLPASQVPSQILQSQSPIQAQNVLQQQQSLVNHQLQRNLSQNLPQQQVLSHSHQQNLMPSQTPDHLSQQLQMPDNQIQLQLLQKLHQQQQLLLHQQPGMQQSSQLTQLQDQQKQLLDIPPNFPRSTAMSQLMDSSQATSSMHPQSHVTGREMTGNNSQTNLRFAQPPKQQKLQQSGILSELPGHVGSTLNSITNQLSAGSNSILTGAAGGGPSAVTDDVPSCSTSPSTNNCPNVGQSITNGRNHRATTMVDEIAQSSVARLNSGGLEPMSSNSNLVQDLQQNSDVKPSLNISKSQNQGFFATQTYLNGVGTHIDYLDSSSSATSVLSQNDGHIPQNNNSMSFNSQSMLFRDASQDGEAHGDPRNTVAFGANIDNQLGMPMMPEPLITKNMVGSGKDFSSNISSGGGLLSTYENPKESQAELSPSMVSQSFGVPDMAFNSIDSTIHDGSFMNTGAWAPPQIPRMRTYTKVYKRGAVGRSIDITRYSGYDELKQDLARRFGIEGQLEDRQRVGWKLVYVDHENDVLLVGDDPWEEFVTCVRCIKILSPQEVQQMSLDGDFGNSVLPNQACSSSDNGVN
ncbi:UNVERIFIED_CONTAM: Auxin response factor 19 [Sesamum indicum]